MNIFVFEDEIKDDNGGQFTGTIVWASNSSAGGAFREVQEYFGYPNDPSQKLILVCQFHVRDEEHVKPGVVSFQYGQQPTW